ncbi:MAG TPA: type II CAAX endopeptidase family protein [Dyella sp.]|nr:type II CAAX endopeptidase family protein [Dyella sp.]
MSEVRRTRHALALAGYALAAVLICLALSRLAARITGHRLLDQAQQQLADVQTNQPLWQWRLRKPHDLIAGRAFGNATVAHDDDALLVSSDDGTPFELGLPVAWSLDLKHWSVLQLQLRSSAPGTLGLVWQGNRQPPCLALAAGRLTPDVRTLRIDLRGLAWKSAEKGDCAAPGTAQMLRLRIQLPAHATLLISSAGLLTTEPMPRLQDATVDIPANATQQDVDRVADRVQSWPMPLFHLPHGADAETMLAMRDRLRARWPAALIVPAGAPLEARTATPFPKAVAWSICAVYLLALAWLAWRPVKGRLRPWVELAGCLLGPLWLVAGLHWGLRPTPLGITAFGAGMAFALAIERRHWSRLWHLPVSGRDWLWPLATVPVTVLLIAFYGHALQPLSLLHMLAYVAWAWLQQWLMLIVLLRRFEQIRVRPSWAIVLVALVFALLHTPNGMLMQLCFVGELWWAWCFLRSRSVLPVALAHTVCALLVESGLSGSLVRSLEVSARFFL